MTYLWVIFSLFVAGVVSCGVAVYIFVRVWRGPSRGRAFLVNGTLSLMVFYFLALSLELFFYFFVVHTDAFNYSRASQRWYSLYWKPLNSYGVRRPEPDIARLREEQVLLVLGDSLAAGFGVRDYRDCFPEKLGERLGDDWSVVTLADPGWDTATELERMRDFPVVPDRVLLQYYPNDIANAAEKYGEPFLVYLPRLPQPFEWLVWHSHVLNEVYLSVVRLGMAETLGEFWGNMRRYYEDPEIWGAHKEEIEAFMAYCAERDIPVDVVMFPNLFAVEESAPMLRKAAGVFESGGARVFDVSSLLKGRDPMTVVAHPWDPHPNALLHGEVAEYLYGQMGL